MYVHNNDTYTCTYIHVHVHPVLQYGNDPIMSTSSYTCTYDYNMTSFKQEVLTKTILISTVNQIQLS